MKFGAGRSKFNLIVLAIVLVFLIVMFYQGTNMKYKIEGENVRITWFAGVNIPRRDIMDVKVLQDKPKMTRIVGVSLFTVKEGTYTLEGVGRVRMYANNINKKLVLVTTDKMTYCITPDNPEQFVKELGFK
jgi:Protein of unknown function (DUF2679).